MGSKYKELRFMDTNRLFELNVGDYFHSQGYEVDVTKSTGDWGVDVFIQKDGEKGVVQVKNYGNCRTRISRKDVMELYGAMAFFDCNFAVIVYNGAMNDDAIQVARKLGIECIYMSQILTIPSIPTDSAIEIESFEDCWNRYVVPLKGQNIITKSHKSYKICDVRKDKIIYENTNGKEQHVKIDIFKWTFNRILSAGIVHGKSIRDEFHTIHSSLVVAVFSYIPYFEIIKGPYIKLKNCYTDNCF